MNLFASLLALQLGAAQVDGAGAPARATKEQPGAEASGEVAPLPAPQPAPARARWSSSEAVLEGLAREAEAAAAARSPLALGRLYRLWNVNKLVERPRRVEAAIEAVLSVPRGDPLLVAHARSLRAELLAARGRPGEAEAERRALGLASEAMLLGPFENSAGQGHEEQLPPELELRLDQSFDGKAHPVRWREVGELARAGVFELSSLVSPATEATAYVLVAVVAKRPTSAALRVGASDQLKVFFDGVEVHAVDARRPAALDQEVVALALPAGESLLLFKASWVSNPGRLMFRLTAPDGGALEGVAVRGDRGALERVLAARRSSGRVATTARRPGARAAAPRPAGVFDGLDRSIERTRGAERADALALRADLAAVLATFDRRKLPTPPERDLEAAIRLAPADPTMRFFYAHRSEERDPALAREQLEAALASDPGHVPSLYKLASLAREAGRSLEANQRLEEALARDPSFVPAAVARASLRFESSLDRDLALLDLEARAEALGAATVWSELARMRRAAEDRAGARRDAERALALDHTDLAARELLVDLALDASALGRALELLDQAVRLEPWRLGPRLRKARALAARAETRAAALALLAELAALFPDAVEVPNLTAEVSLFGGDTAAARVAVERSLELDPNQPNVRRHRGALSGALRELADDYGVDAQALVSAPVSPEEASWGAVYLADRTAVRLYENGQSSRFQQLTLRLHNPKLKDALRVQRVPYTPSREVVEILAAERIRPNGEVMKASSIGDDGPRGKVSGMYVDRRTKTIVFDDLAAGDVVNVRYRLDSVGANMFGSFFGDLNGLETSLPKQDVLYTVIAPKGRPLFGAHLHAKPPEVTTDGALTRLTWRYDRLDAVEFEAFAPPYPELAKTVSVSTYSSWDELGRWYAKLYAEQLELDEAARAAGKRAVAGAKTDAEKIRRLYDYVVKNTRYVGIELGIHGWKPFKAAEVHRRRYGDCKDKATLLAALLADNGVEATITLVRTADRGPMPPTTPRCGRSTTRSPTCPRRTSSSTGPPSSPGASSSPTRTRARWASSCTPTGAPSSARSPRAAPRTT